MLCIWVEGGGPTGKADRTVGDVRPARGPPAAVCRAFELVKVEGFGTWGWGSDAPGAVGDTLCRSSPGSGSCPRAPAVNSLSEASPEANTGARFQRERLPGWGSVPAVSRGVGGLHLGAGGLDAAHGDLSLCLGGALGGHGRSSQTWADRSLPTDHASRARPGFKTHNGKQFLWAK